jgi:4-methyl-5(b-hydroxyethyl)-thiazole monophosphate biosynthesis
MVYMFLANGFEEIEALCPLDLLRRAGNDVCIINLGGAV